jgi:multiple sugar transport system ATP-binding protein
MNLAEATLADDDVAAGSLRLPLARHGRPRAVEDRRVVVGIRPEAFEDAAFASGDLPQIEVRVEGAVSDEPEDETSLLAAERDRTLFAARVDPRTAARVGGTVRLAVDPSRLYFFSPTTGEALLGPATAAVA